MKNLFVRVLAVVALAVAATVQTMAQESFSYQVVIRDGNGTLVNSGKVGLRFTLLNGGKDYYVETQTAEPNKYGNISVMIGAGTKVSGDFAKVPWNTLDVTLKVEVDVKGGTDYKPLGETKLSPVPYAMYAPAVDKAVGAGSAAKGAETLFEVDDRNGRPVFAVTNDGIVVYVDDQDGGKLRRSGFLVTGREATKGEPAKEYFSVSTDGTQIFVDEADDSKLRRSGFLVTGREATKNGSADYLSVDGNGTTVYVDRQDDSKLRRSGFLVTGREATKGEETSMFAVDGSTTTVYVEDQDGGKLRRSGFLVTGREATKSTERFVDVTADAVNLRTETFTVANTAPGDDAAAVPAPVLVVSRQLVEMKTDVAMEGDVLPATYGTFEKEYEFDLQLTCSTQYSIPFDTLLARAGVSDFQNRDSYYDSLMFVYDDGLTVGSTWEWGSSCLYFDQDFQRTSNSNNLAFYIRKYAETWTTVEFVSQSNDLILHNSPVKLALGYRDDQSKIHTVLITVNLTVDKFIYPYGIEKGTVKYEFRHDKNGDESTDIIDYCFSDNGWSNFFGVDVNDEDIEGRGKYTYVANSNNKSDSYDIDGMNTFCCWYYDAWSSMSTEGFSYYPMFSIAGVAVPINDEFFNNASGIAGLAMSNLKLCDVTDAGDVNDFSINNKTIGGVKKYTYHTDEYTLYFYTYQGLVLQIDKKVDGESVTTNILKCISFDDKVSEPSFHRWLKNSGVTNYDGISDGFGDLSQDDYGHYYVDLNLPSGNLWAANNVGAPSPYDWGDYLAWGELEEKESYTQDGYSVTELNNNNDAAWKWGENLKTMTSDWCMPSSADWQELIYNCLWVWIDGEPGVRVYKALNESEKGASKHFASYDEWNEYDNLLSSLTDNYDRSFDLFLPLSGSYDGTSLNNGMKGLYWASDRPSDQSNAYSLDISSPSNKHVKENKRYQGMQVRAVAHKNTKYWVSETANGDDCDGSLSKPFKTIEQAIAIMDKNDGLMTYTLMVKGQIEPAEIINCGSVKQITLCGASGLDENGEPKDAIVGNISKRPLTVNSGNIIIKNLKLTGGGISEQNAASQIGKGGGLRLENFEDAVIVTLDTNAYVMNNAVDSGAVSYGGGVYVGSNAELIMHSGSKISGNKVGGTSFNGQGGGVFVKNGRLVMYGGEISGNQGIGTFTTEVEGQTVSTGSQGGGVYVGVSEDGITQFYMFGGRITGNSVNTNGVGGGLYKFDDFQEVDRSFVHLYGGEISGNTTNNILSDGDVFCFCSSGDFSALNLGGDFRTSLIKCVCRDPITIVIGTPLTTGQLPLSVDISGNEKQFSLTYYSYESAEHGRRVLSDAISKFGLNNDSYNAKYSVSKNWDCWVCTVKLTKTNK